MKAMDGSSPAPPSAPPSSVCCIPASWTAAVRRRRVASRLSLRSWGRRAVAGTGFSSSGWFDPKQHMAGRARPWNK
eukprot:1867000-Prymnesium_polylepis.1